jgi:hypothetical protein
LCSIDPVGKGG